MNEEIKQEIFNKDNELIDPITDQNNEEIIDETLEQKTDPLLLAQKEAKENWDKVLRLQAEIENLRKRTFKDIENASRGSIERVIQEILPVLDSFELGIKVDTSTKEGVETFIEGQTSTFKLLKSVLKKLSIETIDPKDMQYDASFHEVITMVEDKNVKPGYIIEVIQKGYRLQQRLLRPARVIVSSDVKKK
ncbi:MAG: nucleotide exchange factor GrpE [Gammaproteobacteria bacterium]|nr:nucleotide exchange factor GrpE [Gammaproteobacteria bacterium]